MVQVLPCKGVCLSGSYEGRNNETKIMGGVESLEDPESAERLS